MGWRMMVLLGLLVGAACMTQAVAQSQLCGGEPVPAEAVRCPDGSIPSFSFDAVAGDAAADSPPPKVKPQQAGVPVGSVFGVWHTNLPGTSYASAIDVPGFYMLNLRPGIAPGDLTIDPNGAYVWNSIRGTNGHWSRSRKRLVVLNDDVAGKHWTVKLDHDHLKIVSGDTTYIGRR